MAVPAGIKSRETAGWEIGPVGIHIIQEEEKPFPLRRLAADRGKAGGGDILRRAGDPLVFPRFHQAA